jgi:hypothetical protein
MADLVDQLRKVDHMSVEDCFLQSPLFAKAAAENYWSKSQPTLANAFGLVQQAMEMVRMTTTVSSEQSTLRYANSPADGRHSSTSGGIQNGIPKRD